MREFLHYLKEQMGIGELYISVELENTAAHDLYEKLGFRFVKEISYEYDGIVYRENQMRLIW